MARSPTPRFRRVFVVLMILVAVPSLAVSGFGIMAIVDARDVAEARLKQSYEERLKLLATDLAVELARTEPASAVGDEAAQMRAERARQVLPALAQARFPGEATEVTLLSTEVQREELNAERVRVALKEWMEGRAPAGDLFKRGDVAELQLPPPLAGYRLRAALAGDQLLAARVRTTAALYAILLVVFYVLLILGVVLVSVSMYREVQLGRLKTDFVSHVSHELRTPLTSIRMFLETLLLERVRDEEEKRECLQMCARETERLSGMIERVLDWAKMEAGKRRYEKENVPVAVLVERSVKAFATHTLEAPYQLTVENAVEGACVEVDGDAIVDAIINLLHNAFKYTTENKQIGIKMSAHGNWVDIAVSDNGMGVAKSEQKKIFDRFYRAEDLLTQRTHGSGLGLALAKHIVEAHGGRIILRSVMGQGSTFTVRLRASRGPVVAPAAAKSATA